MATQVQFRRGTTAEHTSFTGAIGEVTVDTTLDTIRVHDGATAGGIRIAKYSEIPSTFSIDFVADDSATLTVTADGTETLRFAGGTNINTSTDSAGTVIIATNSDLTANTLSSSDSTAITINDDINLAGVLRSEDSGTVSVDGAMSISGAVTSGGNITATGSFIIGSADMNETDLEKLDGITNGTAAANKALVADSNIDIASLRNITATGTVQYGSISDGTITITAFVDEDNMASDSATLIPTQQSVKAYVDNAVSTGTSAVATEATNVTVTANNTTDETVYITFVDGATGTQGIETDTGLSYNPSTNILSTTASQAQYADLAEKYSADATYDVGHVMIHGGTHEITQSTVENDTKIAGVVSEKWAYLMNQQEDGPAIALKGKVECKVVGSVRKGDLLVTSNTPGHAVASDTPNPFAVIGRSLVDDDQTHPRIIFIKI